MAATRKSAQIPTAVKVGCLTYRVLTDADAIRAVSASADIHPGSEWSAYSDHDRLLIGVNADNPVDAQRRDLVHELLHCCLRIAGAEPNAYARVVQEAAERHGGYSVEEFMVGATAAPLLGVLRDNPDLAGWLLA